METSCSQRDTPVALRTPYLRVLGLEVDREGAGGAGVRNFTAEEEEEFEKMGKQPGIYEKFARSIAPSIFGNDGASCLTQRQFLKGRQLTSSTLPTQISRSRSLVSCSVDRRRCSPTVCGCEETSTCSCWEIPVRRNPSCSSSSKRCRPSQCTRVERVVRRLD